MDTVTHVISGAVIGAATAARDGHDMPKRALWGALFAAFPDCDTILALFIEPLTYINVHRGYTHSLVLLPVWAALLGWLGAALGKRSWRDMATLAAAALAAHILGDIITAYGTRIFTPIHNAPLAFPITFIIDPLFTLILLVGLLAALRKRRPVFAIASGLALAAYLLLQTVLQQRALELAHEHAVALGEPDAPVVAFPQPLSPFNWKLVVAVSQGYHRAYVNLLADSPPPTAGENAGALERLYAAYRPPDELVWKAYPRWPAPPELRELARQAWAAPVFAGFREFALLPYVTTIRGDTRHVCVWFNDLRFNLPGISPPFEYAMCRNEQGEWVLDLDAEKE